VVRLGPQSDFIMATPPPEMTSVFMGDKLHNAPTVTDVPLDSTLNRYADPCIGSLALPVAQGSRAPSLLVSKWR
jgi:hypothetical protein